MEDRSGPSRLPFPLLVALVAADGPLAGPKGDAAGPAGPALPRRSLFMRNGPCPCGSGKKYKRCCRRPAPPAEPEQR
jgi:hypothetical protein